MAKAEVKLSDEVLNKLSRLGDRTDEISEKMLAAGAEVVENTVRQNLRGVIGKGKNSKSTGELLRALGTSAARQDKNGNLNVKIGFANSRSDEKSNAMIAAVMEYGKSGQPPRPFLKPARNKSKKAMQDAMISVFEDEVRKL